MNDQKQAYSPLPRTNFRGELIQSEPEILNRLLARAERAEAHAQRLVDALKDMVSLVDDLGVVTTSGTCDKARAALAQWEGGK